MSIDPLVAGGADLAAILDAEIASLAADAQALAICWSRARWSAPGCCPRTG